ncbi:glutathione S-transferase U17-like [Cornus florida]|uniref:glutathione S-transferase U17-like n=1 Tax=Cornus florida TaxID=4283 RepID=UPI002899F264|nr:glutathione S-transferase U17-like [Cornus florida]
MRAYLQNSGGKTWTIVESGYTPPTEDKTIDGKEIKVLKDVFVFTAVETECNDTNDKALYLFPSLKVIGRTQDEEAKAVAIVQVVAGLVLLEEAFVKCSRGKAFFGGYNIEYLDIAFRCSLPWLRLTEKRIGLQLHDETRTPYLMG